MFCFKYVTALLVCCISIHAAWANPPAATSDKAGTYTVAAGPDLSVVLAETTAFMNEHDREIKISKEPECTTLERTYKWNGKSVTCQMATYCGDERRPPSCILHFVGALAEDGSRPQTEEELLKVVAVKE